MQGLTAPRSIGGSAGLFAMRDKAGRVEDAVEGKGTWAYSQSSWSSSLPLSLL
jgi:hypothetical protein